MVSRADAAACLVKPGKKEANDVLKRCRMAVPYGAEHVGQIVHLKDVAANFCSQGWLAGQEQAGDIFKSVEGGAEVHVINCFVEAFPERKPNSGQLPMTQSHLRVDFVCERSDGSAIRLHPSKNGKDARVRIGLLSQWRLGIKERDGNHGIPVDHDAARFAKDRALLAPVDSTVMEAAEVLPVGQQLSQLPEARKTHKWKIGSALGGFQALEYGAEYVPLRKGTQVNVAVDVAEDQGYVYGRNEIGEEGWFPATHVELMSESPVDQHAVDAKGASHPVCHSGVALVLDSSGYCGHAKRFANLAFQI